MKRQFRFILLAGILLASLRSASGFALLGPFTPWMTEQLSYQDGSSIGGPMTVGQGYRWNVPVVTYAYDVSFLDYFGSNGVAAVEGAIQILNALPPASTINLSNYQALTTQINYSAEAQNLLDLKSTTLSLLLEQMGLAQPSRFTFCLHDFTSPTNYVVIRRNFDPVTLTPSPSVDGVLNTYGIYANGKEADAVEIPVNPSDFATPAVADFFGSLVSSPGGKFYTGLTMDDVGGLRYLLSTNNVVTENLIPGVRGSGTNAANFVTTALRPGVDKITFQRVDLDPLLGQLPIPVTNVYIDSYIANDAKQQQMLERVISQPDILFTAHSIGLAHFSRTGTTNWVNNGQPFGDGPGVIQPPIVINFNELSPGFYHYYSTNYLDTNSFQPLNSWGSFDATTNAPVVYPGSAAGTANSTFFQLVLSPIKPFPLSSSNPDPFSRNFAWNLAGLPNAQFLLQTSTNLSDWVTVTTITNIGGNYTYIDQFSTNTPQRFFRTIPQ